MTVTAIPILMSEHRVIESAISALSAYARLVANGDDLARDDLAEMVRFLKDYADAYHHGKEEDILFKVMMENGFPVEGGPLAVMLAEHTEGRRLTELLSDFSVGESAWGQEERQQLLSVATSYERLLKSHIQKEDCVLYPMAIQMLPDDAGRKIEAEFSAFQADPARAKQATGLEHKVEEWVNCYGVTSEVS